MLTAQGPERFCRHRGMESWRGTLSKEQQRRTGGRRKRKGNLPKLLPPRPFAEGGACGLAEQLKGGVALRGWAGPLPGIPAPGHQQEAWAPSGLETHFHRQGQSCSPRTCGS